MSPSDLGVERFVKAIRTALIGPPGFTQRELCKELGVTIGSLSKYLRGEVHPSKVGFAVQAQLARVLGHDIDSLAKYYETGKWESELSLDDITGWLANTAAAEDLPAVMQSVAVMSARVTKGGVTAEMTLKNEVYTWPMEALQEAGITDKLRDKMGLGNEVLRKLTVQGEFDDELVEAFSVATNLEEVAVREAFEKRQPV